MFVLTVICMFTGVCAVGFVYLWGVMYMLDSLCMLGTDLLAPGPLAFKSFLWFVCLVFLCVGFVCNAAAHSDSRGDDHFTTLQRRCLLFCMPTHHIVSTLTPFLHAHFILCVCLLRTDFEAPHRVVDAATHSDSKRHHQVTDTSRHSLRKVEVTARVPVGFLIQGLGSSPGNPPESKWAGRFGKNKIRPRFSIFLSFVLSLSSFQHLSV